MNGNDRNSSTAEQPVVAQLKSVFATAMAVITKPTQFFDTMPKSGGFLPPLIFLVVVSFVSSVIQSACGLFRLGLGGSLVMLLGSIILAPILVAIFGFVGAAILFVIWKLMGSNEQYETAYRCAAYAAAIMPIRALLSFLPYVGILVGLIWGLYLLVTASVQVHKLKAQTAWLVFGIIAAVLAIGSITTERAAQRAMFTMDSRHQKGKLTMTSGAKGVALPDTFPKDVLIYKGAKVVMSMTEGKMLLVHFETAASVADGLKFYQEGLKSRGWTVENTMDMGETAMVSAKKAERQCAVVVSKQGGGSRIQVSVPPED